MAAPGSSQRLGIWASLCASVTPRDCTAPGVLYLTDSKSILGTMSREIIAAALGSCFAAGAPRQRVSQPGLSVSDAASFNGARTESHSGSSNQRSNSSRVPRKCRWKEARSPREGERRARGDSNTRPTGSKPATLVQLSYGRVGGVMAHRSAVGETRVAPPATTGGMAALAIPPSAPHNTPPWTPSSSRSPLARL